MALAIGVTKGTKIRIGNMMLKVIDIVAGKCVRVAVDNGAPILVTDSERTPLAPNVFVSMGKSSSTSGSRLAFEAPRAIPIERIRSAATV